jgi:hypothetical protein|tara:strand:- start:976 stop:1194 length:219 start_codon:yes stop_codon:yes gene_type:complete
MTEKQKHYIYIYNKGTMTWKLKKEWEGKSLNGFKIPLDEFTQEQILSLKTKIRNNIFTEEKPKKKKVNDSDN